MALHHLTCQDTWKPLKSRFEEILFLKVMIYFLSRFKNKTQPIITKNNDVFFDKTQENGWMEGFTGVSF